MAREKGVSLAFMAVLSCCVIQGAGGVTIEFVNECQFPVWTAGTQANGTQLNTGESSKVQITANLTQGRFWGRTGCSFGSSCTTGDCDGVLNCEGRSTVPATLVEYSFDGISNLDYYDISLVDGFNLPVSFIPSNRSCKAVACSSNITAICPAKLKVPGACMSACTIFNTPQYCCTGDYAGNNCRPTNYSRFFKAQCPQAYSYSYDNDNSTVSCPAGTNYTVVFCSAAAPSPSPAASIVDPSGKTKRLATGITISVPVIALALAVTVGIAIYWKKFKTKQLNEDYPRIMHPNQTKSRAFKFTEIIESTQNFHQNIGQGGFGSVFFGKLAGKDIAVKVLSVFSREGLHQFQNEVDLLSKIHHKDLVSLLGYCNESKEVMVIYEYMSEGSLRDHLYGSRAEISPLNWKTRVKIAIDAAQGLEYLHLGCTPKIIHRDVKSANILLDGNMNGKLADFGISRISVDGETSYANTAVKGTIGYLDPEYFRTQMLTDKSDVYSFGVVLLEIICGRQPINANLSEEEVNLIQWVTPYVKIDGNASEIEVIIDKRLDGNYDIGSIVKVARLALRCVESTPSCRPSISEVVTEIKDVIRCENENNGSPLISEDIGIERRDLQPGNVLPRVNSRPREMEWADNSSNLSQVGR